MSGVLHGIIAALKSAAASVTDAYFKYVTLLLHGDGTNGAQNNTFLDGSTNNFTITRNGNTTQGSFSPFSQTGWSNYFDGTGDYLSLADNAALNMGSSNFTIESWVYTTSGTVGAIVDKDGTSAVSWAQYLLYITSGGKFEAIISTTTTSAPPGSPSARLTGTTTVQVGTWYHVAVTRVGTNATLWVNGVSEATSSTVPATLNTRNQPATIGTSNNAGVGASFLNGYLSNTRIVKGTAVYTAAFTPPTAPLTAITNTSLLTCQSNRFIDNSSNAFAITRNGDVRVEAFSPFNPSTTYSTANVGGSGYFDGAGDYLAAPNNTAFDFGTGDFTIEAWVYIAANSTAAFDGNRSASICSAYNPSNPVTGYAIIIEGNTTTTGTAISFQNRVSGTVYAITYTGTIAQNTWHHIAVVRSGTTTSIYLNGAQVQTGTLGNQNISSGTNTFKVGALLHTPSGQDFNLFLNGYVSNLRVIKGTAVYTSNFTPPTSPLTAITNTSLLCNFTNGGIFDNASQTVLETMGNAQVSTTQKKYGTGSMYFDGTGDWLTAPDRPAQRFGTADFTVEGWLYLGATGAARGIISKGTASTGWSVNVTSGDKLQFSYTASNLTGVTSLSASTWYHFTAMRTGGSIRVYLNGTQEVTNSTAITDNFNQTNILYVGADRVGGSALNGYLDDIRITNGYARYNNFTVPSAALTPTAYTAALPNTSTTNGAQNNTFLDGSTNNFSITRNGNTTQGTFSPFSNSGWSNYFDGTGDDLQLTNAAALSPGTGDFTIECWAYPQGSVVSINFFTGFQSGIALGTDSSGFLTFGDAYVSFIITTTTALPVNTWSHIAASRSGTTISLYLNGTRIGTATSSADLTTGTANYIGSNGNTTGRVYYTGYISNLRLVKGTAVYDPTLTTLTVPTAPLTAITNTSLLTCQSNRFIDNSTNAFAITRNGDVSIQAFSPFTPAAYSSSTNGGSGYFDGTGDYLSAAGNTAFDFGTGDFTVEAWVYLPATQTQFAAIVCQASTGNAWYLSFGTGNTVTFSNYTTTYITSSSAVSNNTWSHVAVSRSGTSLKMFINGSEVGSATNSVSLGVTANLFVGFNNATHYFNGYLSNLRIVKGTAVYTAAFTPPTAPLTAITNTSLLCNFTNAGIFDAVGINNYETVGNAQASTTQAKFGTTSMYFDGTGDWLTAPDRPVNQLRAGDFTIEGWFYLSSTGAARGLVSKGTSTTGWSVNITSGNKLQFSYTSSNLTGATTLAASTWYHFAVVRSGGTVQIYLNGVQDAISGAITTDFNQTNILYIGADRVGGSAMNGYLDDIRITPGQALYPGNFTPPTAPFPNN